MDNGNEKKIIVRLVCVLLSFGLWLYVTNVENPVRKSEIKGVSVELVNIDSLESSNLVLSPYQKFTVDLKIEGPANEIYRVNKDEFKLKADIGSYALKKGENNIPVQIVNYPQGIFIKNNGVLSVKVNIDNLLEKEVDLHSKVKIAYKEGFSQLSLGIKTEKIKVSGPESLVEEVDHAELIGELKNVDKDIEQKFDIKVFDSDGNEIDGLTLSDNEALLSLKVGKSKDLSINPTYKGKLSEGLSIEDVELSKNKIKVIGELTRISNINELQLESIDLSNVTGDTEFKLKIIVPEGIFLTGGEEYITVKLKIKNNIQTSKKIDNIPIVFLGESTTYKYDSINSVSVTVLGKKDELENITTENIKVEANVEGLSEGEHTIELKYSLVNTDTSVIIESELQTVTIKILLT